MTKKKTEELDVTMEVAENTENETESAVETNDESPAPEEMPTSTPSVFANLPPSINASSFSTLMISS